MFKRSLISGALDRQEDAMLERDASAELYFGIRHLSRTDPEGLTEGDFDDIIAFWSR